jgi:hypothetical protein
VVVGAGAVVVAATGVVEPAAVVAGGLVVEAGVVALPLPQAVTTVTIKIARIATRYKNLLVFIYPP